MHTVITGISVLEIVSFVVGLLLFFSYTEQMSFIFIHIFHPIRGILGLIIIKKMPKSHDIVNELELKGSERKPNFEQFREEATNQLRRVFIKISENLKSELKGYFFLTIGCDLLDIIEYLIQFGRFG